MHLWVNELNPDIDCCLCDTALFLVDRRFASLTSTMRHSLPALVTALLVGLAHAQNDDDDSSSSRSCTTGCEPKPFGSSGMMITSCKCYATAECVE